MAAWGAGALAVAVESGLVGAALILAVILLRPRPAWAAGLSLAGLLHFAMPPLAGVPLIRPTLVVAIEGVRPVAGTSTVLGALALAQVAGLVVGALVLLRSALILRRTVKNGIAVRRGPVHDALCQVSREQGIRTPRLYLTRGVGPAAVGVLRPAVLLPREMARTMDRRALRMVLAHEAAHLARRDPAVAPGRLLVLSMWWFHPVAWILARLHRRATEDASDDRALRAAPETRARDYCRAILAAAAYGPVRPTGASLASDLGGHPLRRRFHRLLRPGPESLVGTRLSAGIMAVALLTAPFGLLAFDTDPEGSGEAVLRNVIVHHETVSRHVVD